MREINTAEAPAAIGPYSQAILAGNTLYISGQIALRNGVLEGNTEQQTRIALSNIGAILNEAGFGFENVVKTTVLLKNMSDFAQMNQVYAEFFKRPFPARAAFEVGALPKGALVEIEAIAVKD